MKTFLISIDTEGDNLWAWKVGDPIYTENAKHLYRFQILCEKYGFKPTYLTNYEMAKSKDFQSFAKVAIRGGNAEIGMHLHAWNTPPQYDFNKLAEQPGAAYLVEYPDDVMEEKIKTVHELLEQTFEERIITHRAGRWTTDERYFSILHKLDYLVDCSVTPHLSWVQYPGTSFGSIGSDYTQCSENTSILINGERPLLEIPVTVRKSNAIFPPTRKDVKAVGGSIYRAIKGQYLWLRPTGSNLKQLLWLVDNIARDKSSDYIMFMLHSSEFMPGGSPTFKTAESIEKLYHDMDLLFQYASDRFEGVTIGDYGKKMIEKNGGDAL
jgi:hypothetical protein